MMSTLHGDVEPELTVRIARAIRAAPATVWQAMLDPQVVARWWGHLSTSLAAGAVTTLDLRDGDFSALEVLNVEPPATLAYVERFMGIGPSATVTWRLTPVSDGCLLKVTDHAAQRTPADAIAVRRNWLAVTERLTTFVSGGSITSTGGPADFEIATELPGDAES
ncbi:MAG TPA: SRPBCC domain-containing protein, partial [Vicinamibacterales bacterium]|nr:SRPBCC domain-containing protein [Vicinamibacterales bacterium]